MLVVRDELLDIFIKWGCSDNGRKQIDFDFLSQEVIRESDKIFRSKSAQQQAPTAYWLVV